MPAVLYVILPPPCLAPVTALSRSALPPTAQPHTTEGNPSRGIRYTLHRRVAVSPLLKQHIATPCSPIRASHHGTPIRAAVRVSRAALRAYPSHLLACPLRSRLPACGLGATHVFALRYSSFIILVLKIANLHPPPSVTLPLRTHCANIKGAYSTHLLPNLPASSTPFSKLASVQTDHCFRVLSCRPAGQI